MTQDSRAAFDEFYNKHYDNLDSEFAANMRRAWQASEQRILDMLGSPEMQMVEWYKKYFSAMALAMAKIHKQ